MHFIKEYKDENQDFDLDGFATSATNEWFSARRVPCFPYALPCHSTQIGSSKFQVRRGQTEMTAQSVNGWVKRFESEGLKGLYTRPGQGRKPIMDCSDEDAVRKAIESDRQSVRAAKEAWQNASGKEASELTFRRFYPHWRKI